MIGLQASDGSQISEKLSDSESVTSPARVSASVRIYVTDMVRVKFTVKVYAWG